MYNNRKFFSGTKYLYVAALFFLLPGALFGGDRFIYKHEMGDKYRILSTVHENVYINRRLSHVAEILNRIAVEVAGVQDGKGSHKASFLTAEQSSGVGGGQSFRWSREYHSEFVRDRLGYISIDEKYFMPVVRNVPVFPDRELSVGDTWSAEGHEMHDFRDSFGIPDPYRIPFTVNYGYLGNRVWKDESYPAFSVSYRIFEEPRRVTGQLWPVRITGASDQVVYWDFELGQPVAYEESFRMIFELSNGNIIEYRGRAEAEIIESSFMDKNRMLTDINNDIREMGIADATVRAADEGIIISLEDIRFEPDSAVLLPGEIGKLDKIAEILARYPDRDILVGGHTALAGTEAGRQQLSRERAGTVAAYLIGKKVRSPERVIVQGYGAEQPLGDNATEEGRRKNRRVEIIILEN